MYRERLVSLLIAKIILGCFALYDDLYSLLASETEKLVSNPQVLCKYLNFKTQMKYLSNDQKNVLYAHYIEL